ncbi:hypothetical protein [Chryseobacterium koreense]|uniref:Uncharacterized protein n=1 Tax=Chryseobacterium koreense CCUG 49689 TaxID=1304281 RepID=A0A0J7J441_9FLAO|nr:hypothetical protein [Chryseobacterium koreense]KMQ72696.1 hypothetical protein ACM44_00985 [Chryseobacterium koreense CCUG 49689]MBB5333100.1 hypothetical protein [Chryseobacterium koreense]
MKYKIKAIFPSEKDAEKAASMLRKAGYKKEFLGYTQNANMQPEKLVEENHSEKNLVTIFTPNLNRAYKAKNMMSRIGAISTKVKNIVTNNIISEDRKNNFKNLVNNLHKNLIDYHPENIFSGFPSKQSNIEKISD